MTKDEALKLALEALEDAHHNMEHYQDEKKREQAITAIKQALAAQPSVPDAMTSADIQEHIEYVAGWNDCRAAMLEKNT
jgi:hypothetical protein